MKKTELHSIHVELKAKLAPFAGYEMPIQYTSVKEEVLAVRNKSGIFDVSHMGEFFVTGPDAAAFVDYLLTNDFLNSPVGKAVYSPLCNNQGKIIDDLIAYKLGAEKVLICVNAANIEKDWSWIVQQKGQFNVELVDKSSDYSLIALQGPESCKVLTQLSLNDMDELPYYGAVETTFQEHDIIVARTGYTGEDGFEIFIPNKLAKTMWALMVEAGGLPCGLAARDVLRLEVCYPLYGHELNEEITPLDSGLKWTVKMDKAQFMGKDALEAATPKYRLVKLSLDKGIPREGYSILNNEGTAIGKVTSGTMSVSTGKGIALALVERKLFPENKEFIISIRNKEYHANYHTKPFYNGGHK